MWDRNKHFPRREAEIIKMAEILIDGLKKHPDLFKDPLISPDEIKKSYRQGMTPRTRMQWRKS